MSNPSAVATRALAVPSMVRGVSPMGAAAHSLAQLSVRASPTPQQVQQAQPVVGPPVAPMPRAHSSVSGAPMPARPILGMERETKGDHEMQDVRGEKRRRNSHGYSHHHSENGRSHHSRHETGVHYGATAFRPFVRDDEASKGYVKRAYQSNAVIVSNVNSTDAQGSALSVQFPYDSTNDYLTALIMGGGPATGTNVGVAFPRLSDETCWFMKVFKYVKFTKFQINVTRMPQAVMLNTMTLLDSDNKTNVVQNAYQSNAMDPGYVCLRPWAGEPQVASFTDGTLSSDLWEDHMRHKEKVVFPACSSRGAQQVKSMCVQPISVAVIAEEASDSGELQYEYKPTPAVDVARIRSGKETLNSYGIVWFWYMPAASGAVDEAFKLSFTFDIELAFFGLNIPTAAPAPGLPDGHVWEDDPAVQFKPGVVVVRRPPAPADAPAVKYKPRCVERAPPNTPIEYEMVVQPPALQR